MNTPEPTFSLFLKKFSFMKVSSTLLFVFAFLLAACNTDKVQPSIKEIVEQSPNIEGKQAYLNSPFLTAGNRVYMVGHQNGSFPELGWHIKGEMGGIWNHPIKLMDSFDIEVDFDGTRVRLDKADKFVNYPFANMHEFILRDQNIKVERWQFVPDDTEGLLVQLHFENKSEFAQDFQLVFTGHSDLRPTWLGERTDMVNTKDEATFDPSLGAWMVKDTQNTWSVYYGANIPPLENGTLSAKNEQMTASNSLTYSISLGAKSTSIINFTIAGSYKSSVEALLTYKTIQNDWPQMAEAKKFRYQKLTSQSKLTIPDKKMNQTFEWLKYNCDWLVRTVPEVGSGITAGIPDYPWWFGVDSEYALMGYMAVGQEDAVYNTIHLLDSVSEVINGNGKIIHEMSTNGSVFNPGNINETPQFASLIWQIYQWNGDEDFLRTYFPTVRKGLDWLMKENDADGNGFPEGFGMMEIHGLDSEMIDVAAYSQKGFADASEMAIELGEETLANEYSKTAQQLKNKINEGFWSEDFNSYADFIGTDEQVLHLIKDAIVRADTLNKPWAIKEMEATRDFIKRNPSAKPRPFVLHHNWVVNTPMEVGIADSTKAIKALETAKQFVNPFGMFVTGIDRDESAESNDGAFEAPPIFTYTGAVMTLPTGVQARAENNYGRPNEALDYLERMTRSFSYALPGSMYEVSPDFGMMTQAWNIYSFAYPIIHQFFGIQPNAAQKEVVISPLMPDKWDEAALENVKMGDNEISVFYSKKNGNLEISAKQTNPEWLLKINVLGAEPVSGKGAGLTYTRKLDATEN